MAIKQTLTGQQGKAGTPKGQVSSNTGAPAPKGVKTSTGATGGMREIAHKTRLNQHNQRVKKAAQ